MHTSDCVLVFRFVFLSILHNALDLIGTKAAFVVRDDYFLLLAARLFYGVQTEDSIGIDVKSHLDPRTSGGHGRDSIELNLPQEIAVTRGGSFAFVNLNEDARLVVKRSSHGHTFFYGDSSVAFDHRADPTPRQVNFCV
mmetsp:Transcript_51975/g.70922  ORF Transcript_51975/g.70922 Transcript_51975/m.70922 type:complete len:139 (-) Transcript_51975:74-490(-)